MGAYDIPGSCACTVRFLNAAMRRLRRRQVRAQIVVRLYERLTEPAIRSTVDKVTIPRVHLDGADRIVRGINKLESVYKSEYSAQNGLLLDILVRNRRGLYRIQ